MTATIPTTSSEREERRRPHPTLLLDVDIHPVFLPRELLPRMPEPWRSRLERQISAMGALRGNPLTYPRLRNGGMRLDAALPDGRPAGSDLAFMQQQHLDAYGTDLAVLIPLIPAAREPAEYQAAFCHAVNEWIREEWLDRDPRLRATLNVPFDYPDLAVAEIERYATDSRFVQVMISSGTFGSGLAESEWGNRKYWPIYEAADAAGLALMMHVGGENNNYRGAGAPSFYIENHVWLHGTMARLAMDLICEGVFDRYPGLQVALIEACFSWAGPLQWAMDSAIAVIDGDLPGLTKLPSEYFREHFWMSTQPIEEPDDPRQLLFAMEFTGMTDRMMFSTDYPHWDFDSPLKALPVALPSELRDQIFGMNAARLYRFAPASEEPTQSVPAEQLEDEAHG